MLMYSAAWVDSSGPTSRYSDRLPSACAQLEPRAEIDLGRVARLLVDDLDAGEPLAQEADSPIDLGELLLAVDIFRVLGAVALRGRLGHGLRNRGALHSPELVELAPQHGRAFGRDVLRAFGTRRAVAGHNAPWTNMRYSGASIRNVSRQDGRVPRHPRRRDRDEIPDRARLHGDQERRQGARRSAHDAERAASRRGCKAPDAERRALRAAARHRARASARDRLRRIEVPEHRRMLERRHRDAHADGRGVHARVPLLRGRHGQSARLARSRRARERRAHRRSSWSSNTSC